MQVWRNLDHGSPSWTLRLAGPGWRASVLDCPDLSAGSLTGRKIAVSPESLNFCKTDAETATVTAHEVEHALASHEAEMLVQDLCLVIDRIQMVEQRRGAGFFSSIPPPEMEMIMQDHCLVTRPRMLPLYLVIALFCSMLAILFACLYHIADSLAFRL
ncbi:hypothetical protein NL676_034455 [Syzygium grande]|nr:hypothetical protein NL676_034455 [Syzygium grande]